MATAAIDDRLDDETVWNLRCELAAAFRLAAHFGWADNVATHMSARLPDGTFLLNPFGLLFEEMTATSLMRMDMEGNVLEIPDGLTLNPAAYAVHSAVLDGRDDANCAIHFHSLDGVAVSALKDGLLPLSQSALLVCTDVAYHDYEGVVSPGEEKARMQADLGDKHMMILRNHGTLSLGATVGAAFFRIYALETACTMQVRTLSMNSELELPRQEVLDNMGKGMDSGMIDSMADKQFWPSMMRKAQRDCPGFDV
ncbi:MAG: class II aldolase/adducin family protein [Novosphingobium sp.]|nr:class II aldolase/adducin family protein [Novosphingobium sp.]